MPHDDRKFKYAPHCLLSNLAVALERPDHQWQVTDESGATTVLSAADIRDLAISIQVDDRGEGIYSVVHPSQAKKAVRYVLNAAERTVSVEGFEHDIDVNEFRKIAVRCTEEGKVLASFASSLPNQLEQCRERGITDEHMMDLREWNAMLGLSDERLDLFEHHMFNLESSDLTDGLDYMDVMAKITKIGHKDGPVHDRFGLTAAFDGWKEVRELPKYMSTRVRYCFDMFMRDMIGDFPDDRISMIAAERGTQFSEALENAGFDIVGMLPPFEGRNALPNYRSGNVAFHRGNGADIVVFSDFMGSYAYAWPTDEGARFTPEMPTFKLG